MADKHTKKELFETLLIFASAAEAEKWVTDGIQHELDLLAKRAAKGSVDVKRIAEVAANKAAIKAALADSETALRAGDIAKVVDFSVQRVTALVKQMVDDGEIVRTMDKKVAFFSLA